MSYRRAVLAFLLAALGCAPMAAQLAPIPASTAKYKVSGTVVNSVTGQAVPRALVMFNASNGATSATLTSPDGGFSFDSVPAGTVAIRANKPGFVYGTGASLRLTADAAGTVVKLTPEAVLAGHVEDREGEPIVNAYVMVLQNIVEDGFRRPHSVANARSNGRGNFRVPELGAGDYFVLVSPEHDVAAIPAGGNGHQDWTFGERFYPGVTSIDAAAPVHLDAAQQLSLRFVLEPQLTFHATGTVIGNTSTNAADVYFKRPQFPELVWHTESRLTNGQFATAHLARGTYLVEATTGDFDPRMMSRQMLTVSGEVSGLQLTLAPAVSIPLTARANTTHERKPQSWRGVMVYLQPLEWWNGRGYGSFDLDSQEPASIADVWPGTYVVQVHAPPGLRVESVHLGGLDLLEDNLTVTTAPFRDPIEVVLTDDGGTVEVAAPSGQRSDAILMPAMRSTQPPTVVNAVNGKATFNDVAPGDYDVYLFERADAIAFCEPGAMRPYEKNAARVSVAANGKVAAQPQLIRNNP